MSEEIRVLYVPQGISWDAQVDRGHKLVKEGYSIRVHEHSILEPCGLVEGTRCIRLTADGSEPILEADSTTRSNN